MKILVADDHAVLRSGLKMMLNTQKDMEVIGEAATGEESLHLCQELNPDVLLLDLNMPGTSGIEIIPKLKDNVQNTKILVLTMHDEESYLKDVLKMGGHGYILKKAADTALLSAIRAVYRDEIYIDPFMTKHLINQAFQNKDSAKPVNNENPLSEREIEVLQLIAQGYTNKQIAEELFISIKTVETYKDRIKKKLNRNRRSELVRYAVDAGLIDL
ncbi:MAG: hypothetical protein JM58_01735 [Peptococcaceae bacterium BICA1-8]|nr:MAG: hypothetical protein JM58_01735 [Peptococcaceae bacterium BICA1-8]